MMRMRTLFCFIFLLVTLAHVDARLGVEPTLMNQAKMASYIEEFPSQDSICGACLEASKKAERALDELELFGEIEILSSRICHSMPSDLKNKCLEKSGVYINQTKLFLQDLFHEENICKGTGLCRDESMFPSKNAAISILNTSPEVEECIDCHRDVMNMFAGMQTSRMMKKKIMEVLVEYCEGEESEKHCEVTIHIQC